MFERLAWRNRFVQHLNQTIQGADCFQPFVDLNNDSNLIALNITADMYKKMFSSLMLGADICYPDESHQITIEFLKGLHCPPLIYPDAPCFEYPNYAPFVGYYPMNPFNENTIPSGYLTQPFTLFSDFGLLGWLATYFPSFTEGLTGYQPNDVIVDISSIPIVANWQNILAGVMPQITINVQGAGVAELHLLSFPLGGRAIITVDEYPNIADIFLGILGNGLSIELERDITSLPIESDSTVIEEVEIDTEGAHQIHVTFLPVVDNSDIPVKFGGGFRKVVLCGFDDLGTIMGITNIRLTGCNIETFQDGVWSAAVNLNDCIAPQLASLQSDIDANSVGISANNTLIQDNINAITANANNITTLRSDVDQIIDVDLPQIALTTTSLQNQITANDTELADHESRITVLENLGTSGEHLTKTVRIEETIEYVAIETPTILSAIDMPVPEGYYDELRIDFAVKADVNGFNKMRMYINQQYTATDYYDEREGVEENLNNITQFYHNDVTTENYHTGSIYIKNPSKYTKQTAWSEGTSIRAFSNSNTIDYQWYYDFNAIINEIRLDLANGNFIYNSWVRLVGIRETEILLPAPLTPTQGLITFDSGGYAYTLPPSQVGTVQSGGNPDNRLYAGSVALNDVVSVELDMLNTETLSEVSFDYIAPTTGLKEWRIYLDGQLKANQQFSGNVGTWTSEQVFLGFSGRIVRVELAALAPSQALGLDNIFVDWL